MYEELASGRQVLNLTPPQALDEVEYFLVGQGYVVVQRTATTLTLERVGADSPSGREGAPKLVVIAVPQPDGGVRIKVRGDDREGVRERQAQWVEWMEGLPKRGPAPKVRVKVTSARESGGVLSRLPRYAIILAGALAALVVVMALVGFLVSSLFAPDDASGVVQALKDEGMPIGESKAYTAENDPNELLGRPGQYTSKAMFKDTRLGADPIASEWDVQNGGSVEVFENGDDAIKRREYLEALAKNSGSFNEYAYREGTVLLRLSHCLTPQQAGEYEAALRRAL
ncbi:MAG: hypothetical protein M3317_15775 [Actinomycetota bacterium]|nr:hypothetical protein [Actinomycetota bacterium]